MGALKEPEVRTRLEVYESPKVTDEIYDMGKMLMEECALRVHYLDAKAVTLAGYTGAIIGLMVSTFPIWTSAVDKWAMLLVAAGSAAGLIGAGMALMSTWPRKFLLPSDTDWLETDGFEDPDRLKRYYISSLHISIASHEKANASKSRKVKGAQVCLAIMSLCLVVVLGDATYKAMRFYQSPSDHAVSGAFYLR